MGETQILHNFLAVLRESLKAFLVLHTESWDIFQSQGKNAGPTQGMAVGKLKLLLRWALVCRSGEQ